MDVGFEKIVVIFLCYLEDIRDKVYIESKFVVDVFVVIESLIRMNIEGEDVNCSSEVN